MPIAVGHFLRHAQLMRGNEDGHAGQRAFLENIFHHARVLRIEADHRLVNHEHFRFVQQRGDDGDALARVPCERPSNGRFTNSVR